MQLKRILLSIPFLFTCIIWIVHVASTLFGLKLTLLGTHPRHIDEWYTIFTGAFIHGDWSHLINNTYPLIILGLFIGIIFEKRSWFVYLTTYLLSGVLIFLFARSNVYHIGISGLVYSWVAVAFLYGSMLWGVLPIKPGVSWDGHLYGAIAGGVLAYFLKGLNPPKKKLEKEDLGDEYEFEKYDYGDYGYLRGKRE